MASNKRDEPLDASQKRALDHVATTRAAISGETGSARTINTTKNEEERKGFASIHDLTKSFKKAGAAGAKLSQAQKAFKAIYEAEGLDCPENFIMDIAFTSKNSFMLTTDGRIFSWGQYTPALGWAEEQEEVSTQDAQNPMNQGGGASNKMKEMREVAIFTPKGTKAIIAQIVTGRSHVLALDIQGNVYSWGRNHTGQLGLGQYKKKDGKKDDQDGSSAPNQSKSKAKGKKKQQMEEQDQDAPERLQFATKPVQIEGDLKQQEICKIFAGEKHSFAATRQGRLFCWGSNEHNLLGLDLKNKDSGAGGVEEQPNSNQSKNDIKADESKDGESGEQIFWEPKELNLENLSEAFSSDPDGHEYSKQQNPFKKGNITHEGFNNRTLIVDYYKKNLSIYSSKRVVMSKASISKMQLMDAQRQNARLQAQVRELQKQVAKNNLITDEQRLNIQTKASKDEIMQNINVLIKSSKKQTEKSEETVRKLEKNQQSLRQAIETLQTQLFEIEEKEKKLLDEGNSKRMDLDQAKKFEKRKHEIQIANYALKTDINKKLTLREKQKYEIDVKLSQTREEQRQIDNNKDMYEQIALERRRFLTYMHLHRNPNDVEKMVQALYQQFEIIRKTCFSAMAKENYTGVGSFEIIQESNSELKRLEKELKQFTIQKDDLRFTLYSMIMVMLQDNIQMRLWINDLMKNQMEESDRNLENIAKYQSEEAQTRIDTHYSSASNYGMPRSSGRRGKSNRGAAAADDSAEDEYPVETVESSHRQHNHKQSMRDTPNGVPGGLSAAGQGNGSAYRDKMASRSINRMLGDSLDAPNFGVQKQTSEMPSSKRNKKSTRRPPSSDDEDSDVEEARPKKKGTSVAQKISQAIKGNESVSPQKKPKGSRDQDQETPGMGLYLGAPKATAGQMSSGRKER